MDLIPIIEYTLLIFIGLLILVILSSYLVFMMRKNKNSESQDSSENIIAREYVHPDAEVKYLIPIKNEEPARRYTENSNSEAFLSTGRQKPSSRFTVLNDSVNNTAYAPGRVDSFDHRFAPTQSTDAFAMFK